MSAECNNSVLDQHALNLAERLRGAATELGQAVGRVVVAGLVTIGGSAVAFAAHETAAPAPAVAYDPATGDYPWADADHVPQPPAPDSLTWGYTDKATCDDRSADYNCSSTRVGSYYYRDQWGYDLRNCTSYVAWRVAVEFGKSISGLGFATSWNNNAASDGMVVRPSGQQPELGDIAQFEGNDANPGTSPGHVAFVTEIGTGSNAGKVKVAEYNQAFDGNFKNDRWVTADRYIDVNGSDPAPISLKVGNNTPPPPPPDTDSDGIPDPQDHCPTVPGIPALYGCPPKDIDRDGIADLVVINTANTGSGVTEAHELTGSSGYVNWFGHQATGVGYLNGTQQTFMADVNADYRPDLVVVNTANTGSGKVEVHPLDGSNGFSNFIEHDVVTPLTSLDPTQRLLMADVNGDNRADLLVVNTNSTGSGKLEVHALNAATHYSTWIDHWVTEAPYLNLANEQLLAGDINGDGHPDIIIADTNNTASGKTELHVLNGATNFTTFKEHDVTPVDYLNPTNQRLVVGDSNADGMADVAVVNTDGSQTGSGKVEVHPLSGATHFSSFINHYVVTPLTSLDATQRAAIAG